MRKRNVVRCDVSRIHFLRSSDGAHLGRLGTVLGSCEAFLGAILGPSWAILGLSWTVFGALLGRLGAVLTPFWGSLAQSWGDLGGLLERLGRSEAREGEHVKMTQKSGLCQRCVPLRAHLGVLQGPSGTMLGSSWADLGDILGHLGRPGGHPGRRGGHRRILGVFETTWDRLGGRLGPSWGQGTPLPRLGVDWRGWPVLY